MLDPKVTSALHLLDAFTKTQLKNHQRTIIYAESE